MKIQSNVKAYIQSPRGDVFVINNVKDMNIDNQVIALTGENGKTYMTHMCNVLLVEESTECEEKE